jgi:putative alpha-1,2-mannosidase
MVLLWMALVSCLLGQPVPHQPVDYVNPLIGTAPFEDSEYLGNNPPKGEELYYGSVVPGAMAPDGVVKLSPDTGFDGIFHVRGSSYRHTDSSIMGFSHTHHEYNQYANILFVPIVGVIKTEPGSRENPDEGYRSCKDI